MTSFSVCVALRLFACQGFFWRALQIRECFNRSALTNKVQTSSYITASRCAYNFQMWLHLAPFRGGVRRAQAFTSWLLESISSTRPRPKRSKDLWPGSTRRRPSRTPHNGVKTSAIHPGLSQGTAVAVKKNKEKRSLLNQICPRGQRNCKVKWWSV